MQQNKVIMVVLTLIIIAALGGVGYWVYKAVAGPTTAPASSLDPGIPNMYVQFPDGSRVHVSMCKQRPDNEYVYTYAGKEGYMEFVRRDGSVFLMGKDDQTTAPPK